MATALLALGTVYAADQASDASKDAAKTSSAGSLQAGREVRAAGEGAAYGLQSAFYGAPNGLTPQQYQQNYTGLKDRYSQVSKQVNDLEKTYNIFNFKEKNPSMASYLDFNSAWKGGNYTGGNVKGPGGREWLKNKAEPLLSEYNQLRSQLDSPEYKYYESNLASGGGIKATNSMGMGSSAGTKTGAGGATPGSIMSYYTPYTEHAQEDLNAYREGVSGLDQYNFQFDPSQIANNPAYQFRLSQGLEALDRRMGASGMLHSGNRMLGITDYAQGLASTEYENAFNRQKSIYDNQYNSQFDILNALQGRANVGYEGTMNLAGARMGLESNIANLRTGAAGASAGYTQQSANAMSAGIMGSASARQQGIGNLAYLYGNGAFDDIGASIKNWFKPAQPALPDIYVP